MNSTVKNVIKYLVAFVVLVVIGFFAIKLIFPEPSKLQAYDNTVELSQIDTYTTLTTNTDSLLSLMEENLSDSTLNKPNYYKLTYAKNTLTAMHETNTTLTDDLLFAENSSIYNSKVKTASSALKNIKNKYEDASGYLTNNLIPFLQQETQTISSLNLYANAILPFYLNLCEYYQTFTSSNITIVKNLDVTVRNNAWSNSVLDIVNAWTKSAQTNLQTSDFNFETEINHSVSLLTFVTSQVNETNFINYYENFTTENALIVKIQSVDLQLITANVATSNETTYINSIENAELKTTVQEIISFIKGVH